MMLRRRALLGTAAVAAASPLRRGRAEQAPVVSLKAAGVDTLISAASIKFGALVIRKVSQLDWQPLHLLRV